MIRKMKNHILSDVFSHLNIMVLLLAMSISISACGNNNSTDNTENNIEENTSAEQEDKNNEQNEEEPVEVEDKVPVIALTETELQEFTDLFNSNEYNGFLTESYNSPEFINWDSVLEFGAGLTVQGIGEDEINDYLAFNGEKQVYGDLFVIRKSDLEKYIKSHTGMDKISDDGLTWDYVQKHDSYYKEHWAAHQNTYTCVSGEKTGYSYELRFRVNSEELPGANAGKNYGRWADRVLKLIKSEEGIIIEANEIQWDDYCDEEQTFDVKLSQFDGTIHFVSYSANPDEVDITLVKDGKFLDSLDTNFYTENDNGSLKKIDAVSFFDINGDCAEDIVIIGDSNLGKHVFLYTYTSPDYPFELFADFDEQKITEIGADFSIAGVKKALFGDNSNGDYSSYQDLYAQLARIYSIADDQNQFDLVYSDDDDIPEFVIGHTGYWVSLVAYENGKAHYLMNRWPYGAGGNGGYAYIPKKGIYYNGNADHAGAIYYHTYMSKRAEGELGTDYYVIDYNFNDLDGDGFPSEDELAASEEYVTSSEYFSETDKEMTTDEIKDVVSLYDSYDMKYLEGRMDYATFLDKLAGKEVGITDEQALSAIKKYCYENNPDLENIVNAGEYEVYWCVESIDDTDIVILYRSYTGAQLRYYIDRFSGDTYGKEYVPGITDEEQWTDEYFNVKDYFDN